MKRYVFFILLLFAIFGKVRAQLPVDHEKADPIRQRQQRRQSHDDPENHLDTFHVSRL